MKRPKLIFLIMIWLFYDFSIISNSVSVLAPHKDGHGSIAQFMLVLIMVVIIVQLYGLFRLYAWAVNAAIFIFVMCAVFPLINIYNHGIINIQTGIVLLAIEAFNGLSIFYLIRPLNRKYFREFVDEKYREKQSRNLARKMKM